MNIIFWYYVVVTVLAFVIIGTAFIHPGTREDDRKSVIFFFLFFLFLPVWIIGGFACVLWTMTRNGWYSVETFFDWILG